MPAPRHWKTDRLDIAAFAQEHANEAGEWPLDSLPRLFASQPAEGRTDGDAAVRWELAGARAELPGTGRRLPTLRIQARAKVVLECQRCLQPMPLDLDVGRSIFFVEGEDAAAALDAESDDDVLALEPATDVRTLVEDELLLALPLIPRHDVCPEPLLAPPDELPEAVSAEHPFAALAALKGGSGNKAH